MHSLPIELQLLIFNSLSSADLAAISQCSRFFYKLATPLLYQHLNVIMKSGNPDAKTTAMLQTLCKNVLMQSFIRTVTVTNVDGTFWTAGHSTLLNIILRPILQASERIKSLSWKTSQIYTELVFPRLKSLECTKIYHQRELEWIRWHLLYCKSLVHLHLAFTAPFSRLDILNIFNNVQLHKLKILRLELVDLSIFTTPILSSIHTLDIKSCPAAKTFLHRLLVLRQATCLKSLRITGDIPLPIIHNFISKLRLGCLEDLYLYIGNALEYFDFHSLKPHYQSLRSLVLDFRQRLKDSRSVIRYSINDFQNILTLLPSLESLGLPLDIRDTNSLRYKRVNYTVSILMTSFV